MRRASFVLAVLTILSLALSVAGCAPVAQTPQTVKIGLITQLTGDPAVAALGKSASNAVEMAVKEINDTGGVEINMRQYPIEMVVADSEGSEGVAMAAAQKLIGTDGVVAIIQVDRSQVAVPTSLVAENAKTVLLGPTVTTDEFTMDAATGQPKKYVFRGTYTSSWEGTAMATFAMGHMGAKTAAVLYNKDSAHPRNVAEAFREGFVESVGEPQVFESAYSAPMSPPARGTLTGKVVAFEPYDSGTTDFTAQLQRIKEANPDVLFIPGYQEEVPGQVKQVKAMGITAQLLGPDSWASDSVVKACGSDCDGAYTLTDFRPEIPNAAAEKFITDYKARYGADPEALAGLSYDSIYVLASALNRASMIDREALRQAMHGIPRYNGVTGAIEFQPGSGDPLKAANVLQIKDGKFEWIFNVSPQGVGY